MRNFTLIITLFTCYLNTNAQSYNDTIQWQGIDRAFITHIPTNYNGIDTVPLVFALHGLGDYASNFESFMGMNAVADTANFMVVYPQAMVDPLTNNQTAFSSGINFLSAIDDVGMISALIDTLNSQYAIDTTRVYATGYSMGGFMSHRLACQLSNRITAIASVSGQMAMSVPPTCNTATEVPIMHIHGTADGTVRYNGYDSLQMISVDSTLAIWNSNNGCSEEPSSVYTLPDNAPDNFVTTAYRWINCNNNSEILLYKVDSADHQWLYEPANDFDSAKEIWKFFMRHPNNGLVNDLVEQNASNSDLLVYPNPTSNEIHIKSESNSPILIYDSRGGLVHKSNNRGSLTINISDWKNGLYFVKTENSSSIFSKN
ncbi:T9SS type A sorting domain-containing protein [Flavobacteriales bacterium]|nr:T9SS type A sorting domain-containing protein [Flavobacteriales bacterium]